MALNQLSQAGMKMLTSEGQVQQMRQDLNRVNLKAIKRESAWVTDCPDVFVNRIFSELMEFLESPRGLSYASHWLDSIVKRTFKSMAGLNLNDFRAKETMEDAHKTVSSHNDHNNNMQPSNETIPTLDDSKSEDTHKKSHCNLNLSLAEISNYSGAFEAKQHSSVTNGTNTSHADPSSGKDEQCDTCSSSSADQQSQFNLSSELDRTEVCSIHCNK